jgi:hypothetical protein
MRVLQDERFKEGTLTLREAMSSDGLPAYRAAEQIEQAARPLRVWMVDGESV